MNTDEGFEEQVSALLRDFPDQAHPLYAPLLELFDRYRAQQRLLDRLVHISDRFQGAERQRGMDYAQRYQRKVRQIEKIVRISDQYQNMLRELNERLQWLSTRDELTGLPNRRYMMSRLEKEVAHVARGESGFCVAMVDIDHFKLVNDRHGHVVGDRVLIRSAKALQDSVREYDICARWGGEEFLILFPRSGAAEAPVLAERLRASVLQDQSPEISVPITVSVGITACVAGEDLDTVLRRADAALYEAKQAGRDRVAVA